MRGNRIPPIAAGTTDLVAAVNDRLRRLAAETAQADSSAAGPAVQVFRATFATPPKGLEKADAGRVLWRVTDYAHLLLWTGVGWEFADAEGGFIAGRVVAPDGAGWQLCDGSATSYLKIVNGVTSAVAFTTPNLTGIPGYLKMGAAYTGGRNAAAPPTMGTPSAPNAGIGTGATNAAGSGHTHTISLVPGDPIANLVMLPYFRR